MCKYLEHIKGIFREENLSSFISFKHSTTSQFTLDDQMIKRQVNIGHMQLQVFNDLIVNTDI